MKKTKVSLPSRRKKALRRILIMAAALFVVNGLQHIGLLLPRQAVCELEQRAGTGHTAVVARDWARPLRKTQLVYLSENEKALMLSDTYFTLYGWMPGFSDEVDCTAEAPLHAGWRTMGRDGGATLWYFYGRVDDPAVTRVDVMLRKQAYDEQSRAYPGDVVAEIGTEDFFEKGGYRYFLLRLDDPGGDIWERESPWVETAALRADGTTAALEHLSMYSSAMYY